MNLTVEINIQKEFMPIDLQSSKNLRNLRKISEKDNIQEELANLTKK